MNEARIRQIFWISILLKGADALLECAAGIALFFVSTEAIVSLVNALTQEELMEDPGDFVANWLRSAAGSLSVSSERFYALYLFSHGLIKIAVVMGLLREKLSAYPASLIVFGLFVIYQLYRFEKTHTFGLLVLTVFDLFVMALIWHEYRLVRRHLRRE